jgi:hypothetical protein
MRVEVKKWMRQRCQVLRNEESLLAEKGKKWIHPSDIPKATHEVSPESLILECEHQERSIFNF